MLKTLKAKISIVYYGLVFLIALVGLTSVFNLMELEKSVNGLLTRNYTSISAASDMTDLLAKQDKAVITFLSMDEEKGMNDYFTFNQAFRNSYNNGAHYITEQGEQSVFEKMNTSYSNYEKMFTKLVSIKKGQGLSAAEDYYNQSMLPVMTDIQEQIRSIISVNQTAMFNNKDAASANAKISSYTLLLITLLAVVVGLFVSRYFVNRFLKPLQELAKGISTVKAGELDLTLAIRTQDEAGRLASEFNEMTKRLSVYEKSTMGTLLSERNKSVAIVKSISDPLVVMDNSFRIMLLNTASEKFFKIEEEKVVNKHFLEVIHNGELFDLISKRVDNNQVRSEKILHFNGDENLYYSIVVTQVLDMGNKISGYILLMQNVTELKKLEQAKTDFMSTVSHEFKTPLTSIIMGTSMLGNVGELNSEQLELVTTIAEDSERLSTFVNELLEISRMEAGESIYHFGPCSIHAIVENSRHQFRDYAAAHKIMLSSQLDEKLPLVYADFEKVTWVLNNLLSNALKYSEAEDVVQINAIVKGEQVEVSVSDTGEGIPKEYLDRIFERFVQVKGRDIEVRGTGLGLSVAKEMIVANGGNIRVESELGVGSTFRFTLPLYNETIGKGID